MKVQYGKSYKYRNEVLRNSEKKRKSVFYSVLGTVALLLCLAIGLVLWMDHSYNEAMEEYQSSMIIK